ncbi:hypothetical protein SNE40_018677 [Patella caerulea]|uniref:Uncharacterized protein n=1 Tax=Patella caerulea TaxID=87958 RepID=A0AAN8PGY6_PATCE
MTLELQALEHFLLRSPHDGLFYCQRSVDFNSFNLFISLNFIILVTNYINLNSAVEKNRDDDVENINFERLSF